MKKIAIWMVVICLLSLSACGRHTSSGSDKAAIENAYQDFINQLSETNSDMYYTLKDIDGNKTDELIIKTNTTITVYTFNETVTKIGSHDFLTGTARLLYSNNSDYPGIIYYTVGGGVDHYGYMTIRNNELSFEDLWEEHYAAEPLDSPNRIKEISSDKQLIAESQSAYNENRDVKFEFAGK